MISHFPNGWRLFVTLAVLVALPALLVPVLAGTTTESLRWGLMFTARTSAVFFLLAITASAMSRMLPGAFSRWQRANRRHLGLAFAFSHLVHAVFIAAFSTLGPEQYAEAITPGMVGVGAVGYTLIILMAATSFRSTAAMVGDRAWRLIHTIGVHWLWVQFVVAFGKRAVSGGTIYWLFLAALFGAMILRLIASRQKAVA